MSFAGFSSFDPYRSWRVREYYRDLFVIVKSWVVTIGILLLYFFVFNVSERYSRSVILSWVFTYPFLVFTIHLGVRILLRNLRARGRNLRRAVLPDFLKSSLVDYVYIDFPIRAEAKVVEILNTCRTLGAELYLVPDLYTFGLFHTQIEALGDMLVLNFNPDLRLKRHFDVVFSSLALLLTLAISLLVSLLIKLEDGGPVLYGHKRITAAGKVFKCLKFRTMGVDADKKLAGILESDPSAREEWEKTFKLKNDPRVTRIGRLLRKTSLDELPQFINVLNGEMSVVSARPIVHTELYDYYREHGAFYCAMKPGLTGPRQVSKRSDTEDYDERVQLDSRYVLNHSFWLDMKIIFKTVFSMVSGKGAY